MKLTLTVPSTIEVTADDLPHAYFKLARFFGKLADGAVGDDADLGGLSLSYADMTIEVA